MAIFEMLLPMILRFLGMYLDKTKADAETRQAFFTIVQKQETSGVAVKLHDSYAQELAEIKAQNAKNSGAT